MNFEGEAAYSPPYQAGTKDDVKLIGGTAFKCGDGKEDYVVVCAVGDLDPYGFWFEQPRHTLTVPLAQEIALVKLRGAVRDRVQHEEQRTLRERRF